MACHIYLIPCSQQSCHTGRTIFTLEKDKWRLGEGTDHSAWTADLSDSQVLMKQSYVLLVWSCLPPALSQDSSSRLIDQGVPPNPQAHAGSWDDFCDQHYIPILEMRKPKLREKSRAASQSDGLGTGVRWMKPKDHTPHLSHGLLPSLRIRGR